MNLTSDKKFIVVSSDDNALKKMTGELIDKLGSIGNICYVCISKPYGYVCEGISSSMKEKINFIDVLSSHYGKVETQGNCTFLESPSDLEKIKNAIKSVVAEKNCDAIIIDAMSSLLLYHSTFSVLRMANYLKTEVPVNEKTKIFFMLKDDISSLGKENFLDDFGMFADIINPF